jgi:hypothetical protein
LRLKAEALMRIPLRIKDNGQDRCECPKNDTLERRRICI